MSSDLSESKTKREKDSGSHDVDFTHRYKIVHYFHCIGDASDSKGWTIMHLIEGDGVCNFPLQEFVFAAF